MAQDPRARWSSLALAVRGEPNAAGSIDNEIGVDPIVAEARKRWKKASEAEEQQRKTILEAKKFRAGDQWPAAIRMQREGNSAIQGLAAQPPRPCLTIDRLSQPCRQLSNTIRSAQFSIDVLPNGFGSDDKTADMLKGYLRYVQNRARLDSPIEWAADGAIEGGIGWFRLRTDYVHSTVEDASDPAAFDQELCFERISNNLSVYADPYAQTPTKRDMQYALVTQDLDRDDFRAQYPTADLSSIDDFCATGDLTDWATKDTIRIAEYWRVRTEDETITGLDGQTRVIRRKKVEGFKITAAEVLEAWKWLGSRIPLFPVIGEELNISGTQVLRGIIEEGMDAQRMLNYTYSGAVEIFALAPKTPFVVAEGQVDQYKDFWQVANTQNLSYLPYTPVSLAGAPVPPPERQLSEPPIQAAVQLMLRSEEAIKATTGVYDPSLEYNNPREHSGAAIGQLQQQSETTSGNYQLNVQRTLIDAGEQVIEIAPQITRPGQILMIMGADDVPQQVIVGQVFARDPQGRPIPQPGMPPQAMQPDVHEFYDLKKGKYGVTVSVGKATATQRQEGAQALGLLIPHLPEMMAAAIVPEYIEQLSFSGSHQIAEIARKTLPPQLQAQIDGQPQIPPEAQQQMALMQQQIQLLTQLADKNKTDLMKTQIQQQGENQRASVDQQTEILLAREKNATALAVADVNAKLDEVKLLVEQFRSVVEAAREERISQHDRAHEHIQNTLDRQHEARMAMLTHGQALEQAAQSASLQPQQPANGEA